MFTENDFNAIYGSKYLSATDLHGEQPRYRIGKVELANLKEKDGSTKRKLAVFFAGQDKPLLLNQTNADRLAQAYGKDGANWIGATIELYTETTSLGEGVRLRPLKRPPVTDPISTGLRPPNDMDEDIPY
jgi:hypothetical protein